MSLSITTGKPLLHIYVPDVKSINALIVFPLSLVRLLYKLFPNNTSVEHKEARQ